MNRTQKQTKSLMVEETPSVRASISFPLSIYRELEGIAAQKKVSLAWVVRDAAEQYLAEKNRPLRKSPA